MAPDRANSQGQASEFLASAGHELRTPLNAILGMLELALGETLSPSVREYLTTAQQSSLGLLQSLDELIELAQAHSGSLTLDGEPLTFAAVVETAVQSNNSKTDRDVSPVRLRIAPDIPQRLRGDPRRLQQMISYLVDHVRQRSEGELLVDVRQGSSSDRAVQLEIGISPLGMPGPAERQRFVPLEESHRSKYAALGLNLPLVDCWLKLLHGGLWMTPESEEQAAIYATLELPRLNAGEEDAAESEPRSIVPETRAIDQPDRPLSILVADDTQANQEVVKAVLAKRGHHVEVASNGRQALERVRGHDYDVVLMDAQMPMMNGLEAAEAIRRLPSQAARVPIIALTAHVLPQDRRRCLDAGMDDYLPKPIDAAALVARVEYHGRGGEAKGVATPISRREETDGWGHVVSGALSRLGGDEALLHELIRLFRLDARSLSDRIRLGIESGDHEAVVHAAHNLKGLAANFDAHALVSLAQQLERTSADDDPAAAKLLAMKLNVKLARLLTLLSKYQQESDVD